MVAAIEAAGGRAVAVRMDITKEDEVAAGFAQAREAFGGLDLARQQRGRRGAVRARRHAARGVERGISRQPHRRVPRVARGGPDHASPTRRPGRS